MSGGVPQWRVIAKPRLLFPDNDVFKALEGVGQRMGWLMGDVYQHGLIGNTLPRALMWEAKGQWCRRSPPQRAPTWHWASYEGHLDFWNAQYLYLQQGRNVGELHLLLTCSCLMTAQSSP